MDWPTFNRITFHRLQEQLQEQRRGLLEMRAWYTKYGYSPSHLMVQENEHLIQSFDAYMTSVRDPLLYFAPYRPGIDPFTKRGLSATLRPDFAVRGIVRNE